MEKDLKAISSNESVKVAVAEAVEDLDKQEGLKLKRVRHIDHMTPITN